MSKKKIIHQGRNSNNDEFYTQYKDVDFPNKLYSEVLKDKWIYCPCDDYEWSNFVKYFKDNFSRYELKHLTATHIHMDGTPSERYDYDGVNETITMLTGNGDFRSEECTKIKDDADVIITNIPFSLSKEFIKWLQIDDNNIKDFIIISSHFMGSYEWSIGFFQTDQILQIMLRNQNWKFINGNKISNVSIGWYTSFVKETRNIQRTNDMYVKLEKYYDSKIHKEFKLNNGIYGINVDKIKYIPIDYVGVIAVPITGLYKLNFDEFELIGTSGQIVIDGKNKFKRLLIKNKHPVATENNVNNVD